MCPAQPGSRDREPFPPTGQQIPAGPGSVPLGLNRRNTTHGEGAPGHAQGKLLRNSEETHSGGQTELMLYLPPLSCLSGTDVLESVETNVLKRCVIF